MTDRNKSKMHRLQFIWLEWLQQKSNQIGLAGIVTAITLLTIFIITHRERFPTADTLHYMPVAMAVKQGTFHPGLLFRPFDGHLFVIPYLHTAWVAWISPWNLNLEMLNILFLGIANVTLVIAILLRGQPNLFAYVAAPVAFLMLPTNLGQFWVTTGYNMWHFATFFTLLGFWWLLRSAQPQSSALVGALVCLTLAQFSMSIAIASWISVLWAAILRGYRKVWHYLLIVVWSGLAVGTHLYLTRESYGASPPSLYNPLQLINFLVLYLGAPVAFDQPTAAYIACTFLVFGLAVNGWVLCRHRENQLIASGSVLTFFSLGVGGLFALANVPYFGTWPALWPRYMYIGTLTWVTLVVLAMRVLLKGDFLWLRLYNLFLLVGVAVGYILTGFLGTNTLYEYYFRDTPYYTHQLNQFYDCVLEFPIARQGDCLEMSPREIDLLAAYRLAGFHSISTTNILPIDATANDPVILWTGDPWRNLHVRRRWLDDVTTPRITAVGLEHSEPELYSSLAAEEFDEIVSQEKIRDAMPNVLHDKTGFVLIGSNGAALATVPGWQLELDQQLNYGLSRALYYRVIPSNDQDVSFGDEIRLTGWEIDGTLELGPCDSFVALLRWESFQGAPSSPYRATVVLVDDFGQGIARADTSIGITPENHNSQKMDISRHVVPVTCNTVKGTYALLAGVYLENGEGVPTISADGEPSTAQHYLTSITIRPED